MSQIQIKYKKDDTNIYVEMQHILIPIIRFSRIKPFSN